MQSLLFKEMAESNSFKDCSETTATLLHGLYSLGGAKEFRVLLISHEMKQIAGGPLMKTVLTPASNARGQYQWNYHLVLEYKGWIIDSFLREAKPLRAVDYLKRYFPSSDKNPKRWSRLMLTTFSSFSVMKKYLRLREKNTENIGPELAKKLLQKSSQHKYISAEDFLASHR